MTRKAPVVDVPTIIDGYDLQKEKKRYQFEDRTLHGKTINRGTVEVKLTGSMFGSRLLDARQKHLKWLFLTTHDPESPILELGYPIAGPYNVCDAGIYMDLMLGCAQKVLDEYHPCFRAVEENLHKNGLTFRREINSDDYLARAEGLEGVHLPQDLAEILCRATMDAFPIAGPYKLFFSNSGTEAVEAAIKAAFLVKWRKLEEAYDAETIETLMAQLGIEPNTILDAIDPGDETVWRDYPLFVVGFQGAFHGRTLGSLSLTQSKKAHQIGYFKSRWVRHIPFNADPDVLDSLVDERPLPEILEAEGGIRAVLDAGRFPADLFAGLVMEPMQGEGGYIPGKPAIAQGYAELLDRWDAFFIVDEVQTFARTGHLFCAQNLGIVPDAIAIAKGAVVGATIMKAEYEKYMHPGWHSNTWGGGKLSDTNYAYATVDALLNYRDPVLDGRSYLENERIKGKYLSALLDKIQERHPEMLVDHGGYGLMHGVTVRHRDEVVSTALRKGLKLLGCGPSGETGRIRLLFLADTLTKEVEEFATLFEQVLVEVEENAS